MMKQKWAKTLGVTILTATLVLSVGSMKTVHAAEDEAGSSAESAKTYTVGEEMTETLENSEDIDCFSFTTDETDSFYEFSFTNIGVDSHAYFNIYKDAELVEEIKSDSMYYKTSGNYNLVKLEQNHTYYVKVEGSNTGSYQFKITKTEDDVKENGQQAESFAVGTEVTRTLQNEKDIDCFSFTTDGSDSFYEFSFTNIGVDSHAYFKIYKDAELVEEIKSDSMYYKTSGNYNLVKLEQNHTYYVKVEGSNTGEYKFKVTKAEDDVKGNGQQAESFAVGTEVTRALQNSEDIDCFSFTTDGSDSFYEFSFANTGVKGYTSYEIYKDVKFVEKVTGDIIYEKNSGYYNFAKLEQNHTYYVKVEGNNVSSYQIKVTKTEDDVKDIVKGAQKINLNETKSFRMENTEDTDWFKFETTDYENYTLTFNNVGSDEVNIQLYSNEDYLNTQNILDYRLGKKSALPKNENKLTLAPFKTYYIKITGNVGEYKLGVSATAPASVKATKAGAKKVTVKWKKVKRATGYEIYRAQGKNGKYKKIKTIKKSATVKFTDKKGLKKGKTYYYKVRAYKKVKGKTYYSDFSSAKSVKVK